MKYGRRYPPSPNPQFDRAQTITLKEWEAKGRPRTDHLFSHKSRGGTDPIAWEDNQDNR
jgi:hypothetical protein